MPADLIVHFFGYGMSACMREGPPREWPENHKWTSDWEKVTCDECLLGRNEIKTYTIAADGKSITCLRCKRTSFNSNDVDNHFCGYCHVSHDDLWPPARRWWINSFMHEPLNQFADRIIRNGEVATFIRGLIEKGVTPEQIVAATQPEHKRSGTTRAELRGDAPGS